jgi:hypothetical protein
VGGERPAQECSTGRTLLALGQPSRTQRSSADVAPPPCVLQHLYTASHAAQPQPQPQPGGRESGS